MNSAAVYFRLPFFLVLPPLLMKKDLGPFSMGSGCLVSEMEGKLARLSRFNRFPFG